MQKLLKHPHEQQSPSLLTFNFNSKWTLKLLLYVDAQNILCKFDVAIQQYAIKIRRNEGISTHLYAVDGIEDEKNLSYNKKHSKDSPKGFLRKEHFANFFFSFSHFLHKNEHEKKENVFLFEWRGKFLN